MKTKVVLILILSIALQANMALAFWNMPSMSGAAVPQDIHMHACCKSTGTKTSCCGERTQDDGENSGDRNCGAPACHCPSITMVSLGSVTGENGNSHFIFSSRKSAWKFNEQLPASVYFPIWSPPKLV